VSSQVQETIDPVEELYTLKTVFSKETIPLLSTYKDFAKPDFY
jgi:hypothetical protein